MDNASPSQPPDRERVWHSAQPPPVQPATSRSLSLSLHLPPMSWRAIPSPREFPHTAGTPPPPPTPVVFSHFSDASPSNSLYPQQRLQPPSAINHNANHLPPPSHSLDQYAAVAAPPPPIHNDHQDHTNSWYPAAPPHHHQHPQQPRQLLPPPTSAPSFPLSNVDYAFQPLVNWDEPQQLSHHLPQQLHQAQQRQYAAYGNGDGSSGFDRMGWDVEQDSVRGSRSSSTPRSSFGSQDAYMPFESPPSFAEQDPSSLQHRIKDTDGVGSSGASLSSNASGYPLGSAGVVGLGFEPSWEAVLNPPSPKLESVLTSLDSLDCDSTAAPSSVHSPDHPATRRPRTKSFPTYPTESSADSIPPTAKSHQFPEPSPVSTHIYPALAAASWQAVPPPQQPRVSHSKRKALEVETACRTCRASLGVVVFHGAADAQLGGAEVFMTCLACHRAAIPAPGPGIFAIPVTASTAATAPPSNIPTPLSTATGPSRRKRTRASDRALSCDCCKREIAVGVIGDRPTPPTPAAAVASTTAPASAPPTQPLSPSEDPESAHSGYDIVCPPCRVRYALCTQCGGGGGRTRAGKWRATEVFIGGRRTCSLSHVRLGKASVDLCTWNMGEELKDREERDFVRNEVIKLYLDRFLARYAVPEVRTFWGAGFWSGVWSVRWYSVGDTGGNTLDPLMRGYSLF
ncbi:hypothetical protein BDK51DRAFT_39835 [Blyttiomyces helicus]|uniref:Uncharacterized protein n=1 Tax=Blyttiomyces helicus TaxID=388810 RepID=A0A4P9WAQ2_9FUNG|nr:hypothetical protein BDK51DRAFT_39835 [Blyttiomyces helicus]|eukprot:RKO89534.1 hypothetical protein BDK51DRAFT_39835 [Blyttiomyces helicus]